MRKRRNATIATLASLGSAMVVTVASAGVTATEFKANIGGINGKPMAGAHVIYDNTFGPTLGHFDWGGAPSLAWADDVHFGPNPAGYVITGIAYGYINTGGMGGGGGTGALPYTHTINIYDMVPASGTHGFSSESGGFPVIDLGPLAGVVVVTGLTATSTLTGTFATVTGLNITVSSGAWISFDESVPDGGRTFWKTGGAPVVGSSHDVLAYFDPDYYGPNTGLYGQIPHVLAPYSNSMIKIFGYKVPGPSVIALLGLSGLATLGRRRRK